jgi:hypothetical protein
MDPAASELPPEAIAFAGKMYDAARAGQLDIFQQALPAGLPANMTNEKGDSLVSLSFNLRILLHVLALKTHIDNSRSCSPHTTATQNSSSS